MNLFKGYVETKNKKCIEKFKNRTDFKSLEEVENLSEYAGILSNETILIDIDDYDQSEKLMNIVEDLQLRCRVYETKRGKHFVFKNINDEGKTIQTTCKTHTRLACGLIADIKVGCKNSYEVLKYENELRPIIYDIFEDEEYEEVPKFLLPIKSNIDFLNLGAGEGRNQAFFNYILILQSNGFTKEECRKTINLINAFVLSDPLTQNELDTILRDEAFQAQMFIEDGKFQFDKFARFMINENNIIKINNQLHIYDDGIYVPAYKKIEAAMISHIPTLRRNQRKEVLEYIDLCINDNKKQSPANYIAFKNGIYDILTDQMIDFSPDYIITNKINHNYVKEAYSQETDEALDRIACNDKNIRSLLEECIGYCFYRRNELGKAFILTGEKSNGKSTFLDIIKAILGDENISALDISELGDRFSSAMMFNKLANIGDDISDEFLKGGQLAIFKKIVTGNRIKAERKGYDPFEYNPYCKLLFSANDIPRMRDKTGAVLRRLVIIPFNARFTPGDPSYDPYIKYKLIKEESLEYVIAIGVKGLKRILENNLFTTSKKVEKEIKQYEEENNPIISWLNETERDEIIHESTNDVYRKYCIYCEQSNVQPLAHGSFSKEINKRLDLKIVNKRIDGKKRRIFEE